MTADRDFKKLVRAHMARTGLNYTSARADLLSRREDTREAARRDHEAVVGRFLRNGRLTSVPVKRKPRAHVLLALVALFEPGRAYREPEVNEILGGVWEDYAYLRREMVDYGYLERADGIYRVTTRVPERGPVFAAEMPDWEAIWLPEHLAGGR